MSRAVVLVVAALLLNACGDDAATGPDAGAAVPADAYVDRSGPVFEPSHIVEVSITLAAADWDALRMQTREFGSVIEGSCLAQPAPSPFETYHASVTVDGTVFTDVGLKKKGFFGSLDSEKPSLKVKFDEFVSSQEYLGLEKLTLNNSRQDPSYVRQCVTYQMFAAASVIVPRCNFAHVRVNGTDLGIYVNVESIDHRMMKKRYADGRGPLYEGTLSDFRKDWLGTFDPKGDGDKTDLVPLANVVDNAPDGTFVADAGAEIDVDRFITYWAMEILTNHWDGYANNRNNFFVYNDPTSKKIDFIPWGVDGALQPGATFGPLGSTTGPVAITANGGLAHRLATIPETRQTLFDRERALLTSIWSESTYVAEVNRMEALIAPTVDAMQGTAWHQQVMGVRTFINGRRTAITNALAANPTWTDPLPSYPCLDIAAHVTGTFSTTWGTLGAANPFSTGTGTFSITQGGVTTTLTPVGATSGLDPNPAPNTTASAIVQVFGVRATDNHIIAVSMAIPQNGFFPRDGNLGFFDSFGLVFDYNPTTMTSTQIGYMLGTVKLTAASKTNGAAVAGSFDANADTQGTPPP